MGRAFAGPPARRPHRAAARVLLGVTAACYLVGAALVVVSGAPLPGALVIGAGIEASCIGAWLVRGGGGPPDDDDGDGGGAGPAPPGRARGGRAGAGPPCQGRGPGAPGRGPRGRAPRAGREPACSSG